MSGGPLVQRARERWRWEGGGPEIFTKRLDTFILAAFWSGYFSEKDLVGERGLVI